MDILVKAHRGRRPWLVVLVALALALGIVGWGGRFLTGEAAQASPVGMDATAPFADPAPTTVRASAEAGAVAPATDTPSPVKNIVFVLADDLDVATFEQVKRLRALHARGLTLQTMVTTESLCCPSRASILRSQYVHNHGVVSNLVESAGGWATFAKRGEEADCLPVWLHAAGIQTAYLGKYLNGYGEDGDPTAIPAGWDRWFAPTTKSGMYRGYGYTVNDDGRLVSYAAGKDDFLPDVLTEQAVDFISSARSPFYLQINSTAPHDPAPVATRHANGNRTAQVTRTRAFNDRGDNPPRWRSHRKALTRERIARYDAYWRQRVRSSETIADTVDAVTKALRTTGQLESTLIVVTSDNGFHAGNRRLPAGKRTPYHEDTIVPAILIGPGITPGSRSDAVTSTIDLAPTFAELLGATVPEWADGRSLVPLFTDPAGSTWRTGVLSESLGDTAFNDPDFEAFKPPNYRALRTQKWLFVEYANGARELFDREESRLELDNVMAWTDPAIVTDLETRLAALSACSGPSCREADTWRGAPSAP